MLSQLRLVPVAVGDDHLSGTALPDARTNRREHIGQRACAREIDPRPSAGIVQMAVGETRDDRAAV